METYSLLRELADSWGLLAMFLVFGAVVLWAFRPGSRQIHADVADIPFRHEDRPATDAEFPALNSGSTQEVRT